MSERNESRFFNLTVVLTVIPAYIYFTCFIYEQGVCNRFGIPSYLINPSLTTILIFGTTIWGIIFSSLKVLGLSTPLFKAVGNENMKHLRVVHGINALSLIIAILMFYAYPFSWTLVLVLLVVIAMLNFITWGLPLLLRITEKKPTKDKLLEMQGEKDNFDLLIYLTEGLTKQERLFLLILIFIPIISYFFGDGQALKQKEFQLLALNKNIVVLKKYDDLLVCSSFDRKTKLLGDSLVLIKLSDKEPLFLNSEEVGPLKRALPNKN